MTYTGLRNRKTGSGERKTEKGHAQGELEEILNNTIILLNNSATNRYLKDIYWKLFLASQSYCSILQLQYMKMKYIGFTEYLSSFVTLTPDNIRMQVKNCPHKRITQIYFLSFVTDLVECVQDQEIQLLTTTF